MSTELPGSEDDRGTSRLEAFSDGVIAVAITLLVLDIRVPEPTGQMTLLQALGRQWPNYLGYVTSFLVIGIIWVNHHILFRYIRRTDQGLLVLNMLFLLCVGLIPFVTALVTRYLELPDGHTAAIVYSGTLIVMSILFSSLWSYAATHRHLLYPEAAPHILRPLLKRSWMSIPFFALSIVVSLVSVWASLVLYILITLFYALPVERFVQRMRIRDEQA